MICFRPGEPVKNRGRETPDRIRDIFDRIVVRYDLLNRLLSLGLDLSWRRAVIDELEVGPEGRVLDLCTGTGDLVHMVLRGRGAAPPVIGLDLSARMLEVARAKIARRDPAARARWVRADAERLPFPDASFDRVMVAFGVRNVYDLDRGLREIARVLRPGGRAIVLEFSLPRAKVLRTVHRMYLCRLVPLMGGLISGTRGIYSYLADSILSFPDGRAFLDRMDRAGFEETRERRLHFGIATVYSGRTARHGTTRILHGFGRDE